MFNCLNLRCASIFVLLIANVYSGAQAQSVKPWQNIGRAATVNEIKAWDIDVRPDFKGLPSGAGSVAKGELVWEAKCVSCHGTFGESSEIFAPMVGGTGKADIASGNAANLLRSDYPQRTSLMKLSTLSTLWDYINRAMPWNEPKSLSVEEVYAVTAYILHLGDILPADFVLSNANIAQVQAMLPNRNGMTNKHGMGSVDGKPDVQGSTCMSNCKAYAETSSLPAYALDAHGNLVDQSRSIGPSRGMKTVTTSKPAFINAAVAENASIAKAGSELAAEKLAKDAHCFACHALSSKVLGPSFKEVSAKYRGSATSTAMIQARIKNGAVGIWGAIPMPAHPQVSDDSLKQIVEWVLVQ
jgi:S-disulfanyl-L-cysteine oxidoreductase SoxD